MKVGPLIFPGKSLTQRSLPTIRNYSVCTTRTDLTRTEGAKFTCVETALRKLGQTPDFRTYPFDILRIMAEYYSNIIRVRLQFDMAKVERQVEKDGIPPLGYEGDASNVSNLFNCFRGPNSTKSKTLDSAYPALSLPKRVLTRSGSIENWCPKTWLNNVRPN